MKLKIESSNITLAVVNGATGQQIIKTFQKYASICDVINSLYIDKFLVPPPDNFSWECNCNNMVLGLADRLCSAHISSGDKLLFCCKEYDQCKEITVKIVRGIGGADCDIDVPYGATIGDVIFGLTKEGFLDADSPSATTVLYNEDADNISYLSVKYDDRSKTVKEYGWYNGQILIAVSEGVAYGCPTAKELPGLVPECMLAEFIPFLFKEV